MRHSSYFLERKFHRLKPIKEIYKIKNGRKIRCFYCECDCGKTKIASTNHLRSGYIKSCGCLRKETSRKSKNKIHGLSKTRLYSIWTGIKDRCDNQKCKDYVRYGARGIKNTWKDFSEFKDDMYESYLFFGDKCSIDRIDNNGNYCKENCRWATPTQQANNKRNNVLIKYKNKTKTITEWSDYYGLKPGTLYARIHRYNYSFQKAITKKV